MFDTLEYYEELRKAGLTDALASAIAHGQHRFAEKQLVSRAHFDAVMGNLDVKIGGLDSKIDSKIDSLRRETRALAGGLYLYITLAIAVVAGLTHLHII